MLIYQGEKINTTFTSNTFHENYSIHENDLINEVFGETNYDPLSAQTS